MLATLGVLFLWFAGMLSAISGFIGIALIVAGVLFLVLLSTPGPPDYSH